MKFEGVTDAADNHIWQKGELKANGFIKFHPSRNNTYTGSNVNNMTNLFKLAPNS